MRRYFLAVAVILTVLPPLQAAESIQEKLQTRVPNCNLSEPTFVDALASVASQFKIPVGIELVATPSVLQPVKLSKRRATVMEIFAALVRSEKGYDLRVSDGIVHVFQKDLVDQRSNFLNIRIKSFDAPHTTAGAAGQRLWMLLNAKLYRPPPTPGPHGGIGFSLAEPTDEPTFSLHLRNTTVRRILDCVAISSKDNIWLVTFAPGRSFMPSGFRRTVSPTKPGATSDAGQPGWEMLRWGEKPY
jgi:hypothetical protein